MKMRLLAGIIALTLVASICAIPCSVPGNATNANAVRDKSAILNDIATSKSEIQDIICTLHKLNSKLTRLNEDVKKLNANQTSCKQISTCSRSNGNGVYKISDGHNQFTDVYCQMSSISGCSGGGWTMVMKIDGSKSTFPYSSHYWTDKKAFKDNDYGRNGGLDDREFKGSTYWRTSFEEICVAMRYNGQLKGFSFKHPASSLYDLIADGNYRQTHIGRSQWKHLIRGSSLQRNCNKEGFNVFIAGTQHAKVRLGIVANEQNECNSPDSFIGLGGVDLHTYCSQIVKSTNAAGNMAQCQADNGPKNLKAMGYILVR